MSKSDMSKSDVSADEIIHQPVRLRIMATLNALADGEASSSPA